MELKKCNYCERELVEIEFSFTRSESRRNTCKWCTSEKQRIRVYDKPLQNITKLKEDFEWEEWKKKRMKSPDKKADYTNK